MRKTHQTTYKVLACYAYWLTYGEDDEMTTREEDALGAFLEKAQEAPEGYSFGHYTAEPENWAGDYGTCEATGSWGERCEVTFVFYADEEMPA